MNKPYNPSATIYIYTLSCPKTGAVRYVGVTNNPSNRLRQHIKDSKRQNNHRTHWINSLLRDGLNPIMTEIDETDIDNWAQCEMAWIAHYRAMGCDLVNSTDGGQGGFNPSEETRKKRSESMRGKIFSDEHRRNLSKAQKNKPPRTDETQRRMIESHKIPIVQYTRYGVFIRSWGSIKEAGEELKISPSAITACCKRKPHHRTAGGYMWRYADDPLFLEQPRLF